MSDDLKEKIEEIVFNNAPDYLSLAVSELLSLFQEQEEKQKEDIKKMIEGMDIKTPVICDYTDGFVMGYNQALQDILDNL